MDVRRILNEGKYMFGVAGGLLVGLVAVIFILNA